MIDLPTATRNVRATSHPAGKLIDIGKCALDALPVEGALRRFMLTVAVANLTVAMERMD